MLTEFFIKNLDMVFFIYGLAFFTMAIGILIQPHTLRAESIFRLSDIVWLLAGFGLIHGANEWLDMVTIMRGYSQTAWNLIRVITLASSYIFLFEFGRRFILLSFNRFLNRWVTVVFSVIVLALIFLLREERTIWPRYLLGFPGAMLSAFGFILYYRKNEDILKLFDVRLYFWTAAISLGFYSIFGGIFVPKASFFPASLVNKSSFLNIFGIPVELFRTICAILLAWSVWNILGIFDWEMKVTLRRRLEEATTAKNYAESVIEAMTCPLIVTDADGKIKKINKYLCEMLKYTEEDLIGKSLRHILADAMPLKEPGLKNYPLIYLSKERAKVPALISSSVMKDARGESAGVVYVGKDMREIEDMQEKLAGAEKLAAMGRFSSIIGHELKNQLSVMRNSVYFLKMKIEAEDEKVKRNFDILEKEIVETDRIIENILTFARTKKPQLASLDLKTILLASVNNVQIPERIDIVTRIDEDLPPIQADEIQITRIFVNIILNAIQAMERGGKLTIRTGREGDSITIIFEDTGPGIKEEDRVRIFEPFFSTKIRGLGLGLAVSKIIVEAHGGSIDIESEVGKGAVVKIKLPMKG